MKRTGSGLVISLIFLVSVMLGAYGCGHHYRGIARDTGYSPYFMDPLHNIELYADKLGLTDDQLKKFAELRTRYHKEEIRLRAEMESAFIELNELTHKDKPALDQEKIYKKAEEIGTIRTSMLKNVIILELDVGKLLSDEQYNKFGQIMRKGSSY
ncbi:MAG: Spy/CpxP family protein refolding chaperone [Nitrospirota bacterium]